MAPQSRKRRAATRVRALDAHFGVPRLDRLLHWTQPLIGHIDQHQHVIGAQLARRQSTQLASVPAGKCSCRTDRCPRHRQCHQQDTRLGSGTGDDHHWQSADQADDKSGRAPQQQRSRRRCSPTTGRPTPASLLG